MGAGCCGAAGSGSLVTSYPHPDRCAKIKKRTKEDGNIFHLSRSLRLQCVPIACLRTAASPAVAGWRFDAHRASGVSRKPQSLQASRL